MRRNRSSGRLMMMLVIGAIAAGCSNGSLLSITSPTPPSVGPAPSPAPPPPLPDPGTFTLSGRVTETPPTPNTGIGGAIVRVISGPTAGRWATTTSMGFYSIPDVVAGSTVSVAAQGYVETTRGGGIGRDAMNFQLMPIRRTTTSTMSDTLSAQVGTCSDGLSMKPCHILTVPIHNSGPLDATLTWDSSAEANLDLTLFQTGVPQFISQSASPGSALEHITVDLPAGATYELHVTYASGKGASKYTLKATHQN